MLVATPTPAAWPDGKFALKGSGQTVLCSADGDLPRHLGVMFRDGLLHFDAVGPATVLFESGDDAQAAAGEAGVACEVVKVVVGWRAADGREDGLQ